MSGHYLVLHVTSVASFVRVYYPLTSPDESERAATERWLDEQVAGRQRNIAKARARAAARVEAASISHPTSWYREHQLGAFAPQPDGPRLTPRRRRK